MTRGRCITPCSVLFACCLILQARGLSIAAPGKPKGTTIRDVDDAEFHGSHMEIAKMTAYPDYNLTIFVRNGPEVISNYIKNEGGWDADDVKRICNEFIKFGGKGNIVDIGANIGAYSLPLAACLAKNGKHGNRVISVEGAPWNNKYLRASMKYNNIDNMVLYETALGSPAEISQLGGTVEMVPQVGNQGMSHVAKEAARVPITTIDDIAQNDGVLNNVFAMKIDIEGHEQQALAGATEFMKEGPCFVWMELKSNPQEYLKMMQDFGYEVHETHDHDMNAWCERKDLDKCLARLK